MSTKKRRMDYSEMASSSKTLITTIHQLQAGIQQVKKVIDESFDQWSLQLGRLLDLCDNSTLEFMLVTRLGLEGIDCLRNLLQLIPPSFLPEPRVEFVYNIINKVNPAVTIEECKVLVKLVPPRKLPFFIRKANHSAFQRELLTQHMKQDEAIVLS